MGRSMGIRACFGRLLSSVMAFGCLVSYSLAADVHSESLGVVKGIIQAIQVSDKMPNQIFFTTQNPGSRCGGGTPASVWKVTLDPATNKVIEFKKKQDLSRIQNTRDSLFERADGTFFTGGGWCGLKPPYFSTDGGETWKSAGDGPVHPPSSTFSFVEFKGNLYASTGYEPHHGQVYRWLGDGNWKLVLDIPPPRSFVHRMAVHQDKMFVGSRIYGWGGRGREKSVPVYVSHDGETFTPTSGIPPVCTIQQLLNVDGKLVAWAVEYKGPNRYVCTFNGDNWTTVGKMGKGIRSEFAAVFDNHAILAQGKAPGDTRPGLYSSTDLGLTWGRLGTFTGITALHVHDKVLYLAAQGDEKETSQLYRIE